MRRTTVPGVKPFDASVSRDAVAKLHRERPHLRGSRCQCPTCKPPARKRPVRRATAVLAVLALALAGASTASATQFTVEDPSGLIPAAQLAVMEQAVSLQVATQVALEWPGVSATFGPGGVPVYIQPLATVQYQGWGAYGYHLGSPNPPTVYIGVGDNLAVTQYSFDHEIVETMIDPSGLGQEIEDPVAWQEYLSPDGAVVLGNFVFPGYFTGAAGPQSWLALHPWVLPPVERPAKAKARHRRHHRRASSAGMRGRPARNRRTPGSNRWP